MIVYDITKKRTFENVEVWLQQLKDNADSRIVVMLIGNKSDLEQSRQVSTFDGTNLAKRLGLSFLETSALDASNVDESFRQVLEEIYSRSAASTPQSQPLHHDDFLSSEGFKDGHVVLNCADKRVTKSSSKCC